MNEISQLQIRVPQMSSNDAHLLAREISEKLSEQLPGLPHDLTIPELNIRIDEVSGPAGLASLITAQIIREVKNAMIYR